MSQQLELSPCRRQYTITALLTSRAPVTNERLILQYNKGTEYMKAAKIFNSYITLSPPGNTAMEPNPWMNLYF